MLDKSMTDPDQNTPEMPKSLPEGFGFDTEHPVLPVPFTAQIGDVKFEGTGVSITDAYVAPLQSIPDELVGTRQPVRLRFDFGGFTITLFPEALVKTTGGDELTLQFVDPTGPHLPQLRYILNTYIAGDVVSLGSMMAYTGPIQPKEAKAKGGASADTMRRIKSIGVALLSCALICIAGYSLIQRYTTAYELRPVFITRAGNEMRATSGGQITYLNAEAGAGEVLYSVSATTGDVLNFQSPCDCEISLTDGIFEGATVLPGDPILTLFEGDTEVKVTTQMSTDGLARAMSGDRIELAMNDGRDVPVELIMTSATNAAADRGDLFLPVKLVPVAGALNADDIGKAARVRLRKTFFGNQIHGRMEQ